MVMNTEVNDIFRTGFQCTVDLHSFFLFSRIPINGNIMQMAIKNDTYYFRGISTALKMRLGLLTRRLTLE